MANEIIIQETTHVSKQLCLDYIKSQNTNLTEGEQAQYIAVAMALNLNPFLHEIYPIKYGKDPKMTLVTGYQVYIRRAEEFPQYDGFDTTFEGVGKDLCCVCNVYRKDRTRPVTARVFLNEYHQGNTMWNTKPHVMLEKVAIGTAFRRAFPSEFNGMPYTTEEVDYVSSDESMKAKGFTKVEAEAENPNTKKYLPLYDKMMGRLAEMDNENKVAADAVRAQIKKEGVKKSTVTKDTLENIEHWYETACKLSSSVAEESEEVQ